jgi:hypothetical protein
VPSALLQQIRARPTWLRLSRNSVWIVPVTQIKLTASSGIVSPTDPLVSPELSRDEIAMAVAVARMAAAGVFMVPTLQTMEVLAAFPDRMDLAPEKVAGLCEVAEAAYRSVEVVQAAGVARCFRTSNFWPSQGTCWSCLKEGDIVKDVGVGGRMTGHSLTAVPNPSFSALLEPRRP